MRHDSGLRLFGSDISAHLGRSAKQGGEVVMLGLLGNLLRAHADPVIDRFAEMSGGLRIYPTDSLCLLGAAVMSQVSAVLDDESLALTAVRGRAVRDMGQGWFYARHSWLRSASGAILDLNRPEWPGGFGVRIGIDPLFPQYEESSRVRATQRDLHLRALLGQEEIFPDGQGRARARDGVGAMVEAIRRHLS